ncbi:MAG: hypothetical protein KKC05_00660 [Nanoarchaeota archaeon]|nr:hypothetical protein [Nanoarchaeota archaeon]
MKIVISLIVMMIFLCIATPGSAVQYGNCGDVPVSVKNQGGITRNCEDVSSCRSLSSSSTYYLLTDNISDEHTCLNMRYADDSVLDLNEHKITYNTLSLNLNNPGFEQPLGSGNWVVTEGNPADVTRVYAPAIDRGDLLWGDYFLQIESDQLTEVTSNLINIPNPDQTYVAWVTPIGPWKNYSTLFIKVEDQSGNQLCKMERSAVRAFSLYCDFKPTSPVNVYVKIGTLDPKYGDSGLTFRFDEVGIASAYDFGVVIRPYSGPIRAPDDDVKASDNVIIKNGYIIQGAGAGPFSESLEISSTPFEIYDITSIVNGINTNNLEPMGSNHNIHDNVFLSSSPYIFSRMTTEAQIKGALSNSVINNNTVIGGPQRCIDVGGDHDVVISNNYLSQNASVTNNHAMGAYDGYNLYFINNTVEPINGRGVSCEHVVGCYIHGNTINVIQIPSMEYYRDYDFSCAHGIKLEGRLENAYVYDNVVTSRTGPGTWGACPISASITSGELVEIYNNTLIAFYGENSEPEATAKTAEMWGLLQNTIFRDNRFYSNNIFTRVKSGGRDTLGPLFKDNVFTKTTPSNGATFHSIVFEGDGYDVSNTRFEDNLLIGGRLDDVTSKSGANNWDYSVSWTLAVKILDSNGDPIIDSAIVTIDGPITSHVIKPTTNGVATFTDVMDFIQTGYGSTQYPPTNYNDYNVRVDYYGTIFNQDITINNSKILTMNFDGSNAQLEDGKLDLDTGPICGDWVCTSDENCGTCPEDCGECQICPDANSDSIINIMDLAMVIFAQGRDQTDPYWHTYDHMDVTEDGMINLDDVSAVLARIGQTC